MTIKDPLTVKVLLNGKVHELSGEREDVIAQVIVLLEFAYDDSQDTGDEKDAIIIPFPQGGRSVHPAQGTLFGEEFDNAEF